MTFVEPFADDLVLGEPLPSAPMITLTDGIAAQYQAICGDSLRLPLSAPLAQQAAGIPTLANPGLVLQIAIGQSTVATRRVIANLFYRNVRLLKQVKVGTTLSTTVTPVAAARAKSSAAGARAKVLLSIRTVDQDGGPVAQFERLALIPVRDGETFASHGEVGTGSTDVQLDNFVRVIPSGWTLRGLPGRLLPPVGETRIDPLAEPVHDALALARLTQNLAAAHRDHRRGQGGRRLVYGGHTIGLAQASLSRADPGIATILGWGYCDHLAPVFEGDLLEFTVTLLEARSASAGTMAAYRVDGSAVRETETIPVLTWTPVVLTASHTPDAGEN